MAVMDVRLLVVPGCPNTEPVLAALRQVLGELGAGEIPVRTVVVETAAEALRLGFPGSPTVLVDGVDPFAEPGRAPGLACRVYRTEAGVSGIPDLGELRRVLREAVEATGSE